MREPYGQQNRLILARGYVDRDELTRLDSAALAVARNSREARFVLVDGDRVAVTRAAGGKGASLGLLTLDRNSASTWGVNRSVYLGRAGGVRYFACDVHDAEEQFDFREIRMWAQEFDDVDTTLAVSAVALLTWHRRARFCSSCGAPLERRASGWEKECSNGHITYPRMDPAVIMAIHDRDDRLLLGRNAAWGPGRYSVLAGFVEAGETLESAVRREVFEETRIPVSSVEYFGSQPWPFPQSLMLAFNGWTDAGNEDIAVDGKEMAHAHFFSRDEFREDLRAQRIRMPTPTSVAAALVQQWLGESFDDVLGA